MTGTRGDSVVGSPRSSCSSFFAFPEHLFSFHSSFLFYSTWWNVIFLFKKAARWNFLVQIAGSLEKGFIGLTWIICPSLAGVEDRAHDIYSFCPWTMWRGWERQHPKEGCWVDYPGHLHFWLFSSSSKQMDLSSFNIQQIRSQCSIIAHLLQHTSKRNIEEQQIFIGLKTWWRKKE